MKFEVNIYIETSWKGPVKGDGAAMWIVEYKKAGESITREGIFTLEDSTENRAALTAINEAVGILKKPCSIRVFTSCQHVLNVTQNNWHIQWQKNDWYNAKGKPVKNTELWEKLLKLTQEHICTFQSGEHEFQSVMQTTIRQEMKKYERT